MAPRGSGSESLAPDLWFVANPMHGPNLPDPIGPYIDLRY